MVEVELGGVFVFYDTIACVALISKIGNTGRRPRGLCWFEWNRNQESGESWSSKVNRRYGLETRTRIFSFQEDEDSNSSC